MDAPTKAFQAVKPICVAIGEAAKALGEGKTRPSTVTTHLEQLKQTLHTHTAKPGALHPKLAEYIFFPISQVLRVSQKTTIQCLELCLQCISILIDQGWREHLPAQTAAQLVILCTLLADKKPQGLPFAETTEELQASAFWCLYHIFTVAGKNEEARNLLTNEAHFPQLGKTITVTLDAIEDIERSIAQVAASTSLEALLTHVAGSDIHTSFLPGIMSKLTKTLTPSTKGRASPRVLLQCLNIVQLLLKSTLGQQDETSPARSQVSSSDADLRISIIDEKWQKNAATQLKPALVNIMRLRSHANDEVKAALGRLCFTMLRACRKTLVDCSTVALETLITILMDDRDSALSIELEMLLQADVSVANSLQEVLYDWLQALSTLMQGADEQAKVDKIQQIRASYELLTQVGMDMASIDRIVAAAMRDSVVVTLKLPATQQQDVVTAPLQSLDLVVSGGRKDSTEYESPLVKYKGQETIMKAIESFTAGVVEHGSSTELRQIIARSLRHSDGDTQIANLWLLLTASEKAFQQQTEGDDLLNLPNESSGTSIEELEELYSFALTILTEQNDEPHDPRLQALALRAVALRARSEGQGFRYELLDALYPVLHTLATPDEMLQRTSITTLNILTSACGYVSVKDLIVDNVDYLTNAVALKLNAFDVSPQAPQVLLMMLRLAGPTLLPYLEDAVESIFAALEDYHGYPLLVELLFRVLGVMAEEGVKAPQLAIEAAGRDVAGDDLGDGWVPTTIQGLAVQLQLRAQEEIEFQKFQAMENEPHPKRPWGDKPDAPDQDKADGLADGDRDQPLDTPEPEPPAPRTYSLLLKITELTQHFLPSASTSLRTSLLGLIRTTAPALARHENSFLPLVNTLWPEVVSRLDDEEAHVKATALDIVHVMCECARDFMRTRIVQLWPRLREIHDGVAKDIIQSESVPHQSVRPDRSTASSSTVSYARLKQALVRMEQTPSNYGNTSAKLLWSALQALIPVIVQCVYMPPEYVDEALEMVAVSLGQQSVRSAFEEINSDAAWLALLKAGIIDRPVAPDGPQDRTWKFVPVAA